MTTTPEKIARLRRLHAESETMAGMHDYMSAAIHELPGLLDDLEALREALKANLWWYQDTPSNMSHNEYRAEQLRLKHLTEQALAATEAK